MNRKDNHNRQSENHSDHLSDEKKKEEPGTLIPDEPTVPEQPDENPNPGSPEPGLDEPEKNDPTRIDEKTPIFNKY